MKNPKPYCLDKSNIKAFVLGADPTNPSGRKFEYVFGIHSGDRRYFAGIERNLKAIGLTLQDVYVQNLIQEYLDIQTGENKTWELSAEKWTPLAAKEFDAMDGTRTIPVLVTAERIFRFLNNQPTPKAKEIYSGKMDVPFYDNKLNRPLIPFYRSFSYALDKKEWKKIR
jgi:hypothetical protein